MALDRPKPSERPGPALMFISDQLMCFSRPTVLNVGNFMCTVWSPSLATGLWQSQEVTDSRDTAVKTALLHCTSGIRLLGDVGHRRSKS